MASTPPCRCYNHLFFFTVFFSDTRFYYSTQHRGWQRLLCLFMSCVASVITADVYIQTFMDSFLLLCSMEPHNSGCAYVWKWRFMCNNVHLCTFMYIFDLLHCSLNHLILMCKNVHFENIGFTFLYIFVHWDNILAHLEIYKKHIFVHWVNIFVHWDNILVY